VKTQMGAAAHSPFPHIASNSLHKVSIAHVSDVANYAAARRHGGNHIFEIGTDDIDCLRFSIEPPQPFSLRPTVTEGPVRDQVWVHSDLWDLIVEQVYNRKGHIVYCRLPNGRYRATCTFPSVPYE